MIFKNIISKTFKKKRKVNLYLNKLKKCLTFGVKILMQKTQNKLKKK